MTHDLYSIDLNCDLGEGGQHDDAVRDPGGRSGSQGVPAVGDRSV